MTDYFTTNQFKDNSKWVKLVLKNAFVLRRTRPAFILELVENGRPVVSGKITNGVFQEVYDLLGTPLMMNDDKKTFFNAPSGTTFNLRLKYLWLINQTYKIYSKGLDHGTFKCEMIDWCDRRAEAKGIDYYTNQDCRYEPWERAKEPQPNECPFSRLWYMWGLKDEKPIE